MKINVNTIRANSADLHLQPLIFAYVSWFVPHRERYAFGKPVELWYSEKFESDGMYTFLPIDHIVCRCAHGTRIYHDERLLAVVPLVESVSL